MKEYTHWQYQQDLARLQDINESYGDSEMPAEEIETLQEEEQTLRERTLTYKQGHPDEVM